MNRVREQTAATAPSTAEPDRALVRCTDLAMTYGAGSRAIVAVHGVTCAVEPGQRIALTGPSGSGKSTLLHLMAGLARHTSGGLAWPGLSGSPAGRPGRVGVVFQGESLLPALDVVENVQLPLLLAGADPTSARAEATEALKLLGIGELAGQLPEELSGGQAQRVAIARVLAARPRLILADEPTGQLDRDSADRVVGVLLAAADALDAAVLIATHDVHVADRLAERWQMSDGSLRRPSTHVTGTDEGALR